MPAVATEIAFVAGGGIAFFAFGFAVGIGAKAFFEFGEIFGSEGTIFFGDAGDVGARVVNPDLFGGVAPGEKDDVGFDALAVGRECAAGQAEDGVKITIFAEDFEDFAGLVGEEAVVGQDDGGAAAGLEDGENVLEEIELLVAGFDGEIFAVGGLVGAFGAEGGIGEDDIEAVGRWGFVDRVAQDDAGFDAMEIKIHQGEAAGALDEFLAIVDGFFDPAGDVALEGAALGCVHEPFIGGDEETARAASGIADREVWPNARIGFHAADDGLDQDARREILAGAFLPFAGGFFEQALIRLRLYVHIKAGPIGFRNETDQTLEINGIVEAVLALGVNVAENARLLTELAKQIGIVIDQFRTGFLGEGWPVASLGQFDAALIGHFDEEQIGDLLNVVAIIHAIVSKRVAETPEFLDDVSHLYLNDILCICR